MPKVNFIHTADLHLEDRKPERLEVLTWILEKAKEWESSIIISGDLFNSDKDAAILHDTVYETFNAYEDIKVFVIPGNYDKNSFGDGTNYGNNVVVLKDHPFSEVDFNGIKLVGVPHQDNSSLKQAIESLQSSNISILIVHGTYFDDSAILVRNEVKNRGDDFFPVYLEDVEGKNFIYIAMGHYHSEVVIQNNSDKNFCYPGSPISLCEADVGLRKIAQVTIDTDSGNIAVSEHPVGVGVYRLKKEFYLYPGKEKVTMIDAAKYLENCKDSRADIVIELKGYISVSNKRLNGLIEAIKKRYNDKVFKLNIVNDTVKFKKLIEDNTLISEFVSQLENCNVSSAVKNRAMELGIKAFDTDFN